MTITYSSNFIKKVFIGLHLSFDDSKIYINVECFGYVQDNGHDGSLVGTTFGTAYYVKEKPDEILERLKEMYG